MLATNTTLRDLHTRTKGVPPPQRRVLNVYTCITSAVHIDLRYVLTAGGTTAGLPSFFFGSKISCSREGHSVASFRRISFFTHVPHFGRFHDVCFTLPYIVSYYLSVTGNRWHNHYWLMFWGRGAGYTLLIGIKSNKQFKD
jgi:hypothetical protein